MRCCDISSRITDMLKVSRPPPPYFSGAPSAHIPAAFVLAASRSKSSSGMDGASGSIRCSSGTISSRMKRRTCSRSTRSSSGRVKPGNIVMGRDDTTALERDARPPARQVRSFYDAIGAQQERLGNGHPDGAGGLEVQDEIQLGGLLEGQVSRPGALEDPVDEARGSPVQVDTIGPVRHEGADLDDLQHAGGNRHSVLQPELGDLRADGTKEWVVLKDHRTGAPSHRGPEGALEVNRAANLEPMDLQTEPAARRV